MLNLQGWRGDVLALLAGAILPIAFAPLSWYPVAILSPAILFLLWLEQLPSAAFKRGWLYGLGMFGFGVWWVFVAIHDFGFTGAFTAFLLTAIFIAFLALFPAVQGYVSTRFIPVTLQRKHRVLFLTVWLPIVWVLFEWIRGWFMTGFPWLNLGYSQIDSPLVGYAPLAGVYAISLVVSLTAGLFSLAYLSKLHVVHIVITIFILWGSGLLVSKIEWTTPVGEPITATLVQGNLPQLTKWDPDEIEFRLQQYKWQSEPYWGNSELIVWPENSITVFYQDLPREYLAELLNKVRQSKTDLIIGLPFLNSEPENDIYEYHSSLLVLNDEISVYHKKHLVPFGEYVPLGAYLRGLIGFFDLPMSGFTPGSEDQPHLLAAGQALAPSICYEDAFGEELIRFLPEATLLINGSNNAWYGDSVAPHQHLQIARMRAVETGRMLMRATTNGISAFVDHRGRIIHSSPQFEMFEITCQVQPRHGSTPYVVTGNWTILVLLLAALLFATIYVRRASP